MNTNVLKQRLDIVTAYRKGEKVQYFIGDHNSEPWVSVPSDLFILTYICDENVLFRVLPPLPTYHDYYTLTPKVIKAINDGNRVETYCINVNKWVSTNMKQILNRQYRVHN